MKSWHKIETAPFNGTLVDLWIQADGAAFRATDFRWSGATWQHDHGDALDQYYGNVDMRATHWMPIPKSPG